MNADFIAVAAAGIKLFLRGRGVARNIAAGDVWRDAPVYSRCDLLPSSLTPAHLWYGAAVANL
jgi:uncharacterized membrane protein (DUF2068 family)